MTVKNERNRAHPYGGAENGAAAYDVYRYGNLQVVREAERPEQRPEQTPLPQEQARPIRKVRVRARVAISPFAVLGLAALAVMLVMVISGYVRLYEVSSRTSTLETQLETLQSETKKLETAYESKVDLQTVETIATEQLGMTEPDSSQKIYVNLTGSDKAEILRQSKTSGFLNAIKECMEKLLSYLG